MAAEHESLERTPDGRHIVVNGRKWRATDPSIPEGFRAELVAELMDARRAVGQGKRTDDNAAVGAARRRVHDGKVALGERGDPWWEPPLPTGFHDRIEATVLALLRHRAPDSSICPSDVARAIGGIDWRDHLDTVRAVAAELANEQVIVVTQGDETVVIESASGPIRLRRGPGFPT